MARACGFRIGPRRYELVVLDGSPRKHKIVSYASGDLSVGDDDPSESARKVLHEAIKTHNVPTDNIGIAIDTGMAAFRTLRLPFDDRAKIDQIIKFEVESQLPQWNIDDVIVDFHVMESSKDSSELLVMGVPKEGLSAVLDTCARAGFEPLEAELETTAMVNAACGAEICAPDDAQILVHIGEESTSVVVMDGGKVREMRAIHIGAATHEASKPKPAPEPAAEGEEDGDEENASFLDDETLDEVDPIETQRRLEQAIKRIRRELGRTVSAARTVNKIDAVYVCGRELPGLIGSSILDVPVYILDVFEEDSGQPVDGFGELVVPYGVAVRQLGGGILKPSLRREELRYAGAFEKVELPLAIVCLLLLTYLGVQAIFSFRALGDLDRAMGWVLASNNSHLVGDLKKGQSGNLRNPSDKVKSYLKKTSIRPGEEGYPGDPERTRYEQLIQIKNMLNLEVLAIEKDLGRDSEIVQPQSALHAMTLILVELDLLSEQQGARPSLRKISSSFQQGRSGKPDGVLVKLDVTFFAESSFVATQQFEQFKQIVGDKPWAETPESRSTDPLETGEGIYVGGLSIKIDLSKLPKANN